MNDAEQDLLNLLYIFIINRHNLIRFLYKAATEIDGHHTNVIVTKIVTGSTAIAGTVIGLAGLALIPITGGLSTVMTVGGATLALTSETAYLGSSVIRYFLNKSYIDELDKLSQADEESYFKLADYLRKRIEELRQDTFNDNVSFETGLGVAGEISSLANLGCTIIRVTGIASKIVRSIRVLRVASTTLGVIALPFQIIGLGIDGRALHKKQRSKKAREFRQLAHELTIQMNNVAQYVMERANQFEHQFQQ